MFYVYILRTTGNTFYTGQTKDLHKRLAQHKSHKNGAKYLNKFSDCKLVYVETYQTRSEAMSREWHLKQLSHDEKEELVKAHEKIVLGSF